MWADLPPGLDMLNQATCVSLSSEINTADILKFYHGDFF